MLKINGYEIKPLEMWEVLNFLFKEKIRSCTYDIEIE